MVECGLGRGIGIGIGVRVGCELELVSYPAGWDVGGGGKTFK